MDIEFDKIEESVARFTFKNFGGAGRRRLWLKLAKMLNNDVPLLQAIEIIRDRRIASGGKSEPETIALDAWSRDLHNGIRLSVAINSWVSAEEAMLISAGEQSGQVQEALRSTIRMMEAKKAIRGAIFGGLAYPLVLILMAFGVLYLFGFKIVPAFTQAVQGDGWHGLAKFMINISTLTRDWLWLLGLITIGVLIVFFISLPRLDGPVRILLDRYVPYNIYRIMQGSTWIIAMAALVNSGLRVESAIEQLSADASPWLRRRLQECLSGMRAGLNMGEALAKSGYEFPDREIIDDLSVYAMLSGFDEALSLLGKEWIEESVNQIQAKMRAVFGVSILVVGGLIALVVSGMMEMQLQMSQIIQQVGR